MSIIYDALKKNGNNPLPNKEFSNPAPELKKKRPFKLSKLLIPIIFFGIVGYFVHSIMSGKSDLMQIGNRSKNYSKSKKHSRRNSEKQERKRPAPVNKTYSSSDFILEGIIYQEDAPVAIINGQVLELGEEINNFSIAHISKKTVILKNKNNLTKKLVF